MIPGTERVLANGARGAYFLVPKRNGELTRMFRIFHSTPNAAARARMVRELDQMRRGVPTRMIG